MAQGFYLVWNPEGRNPSHRHEYRHLAEHEAKRLARENPGTDFFVLLAVSSTKRVDVETIKLDEPDPDLPF